MSSRLQLDVRNLSLGMRHLVNAYEVKAGIGVIAGKTVWSMPERLACTTKWVLHKYTYLYFWPLYKSITYLFFYEPSDWLKTGFLHQLSTGWEDHIRNDLWCVEWDVKPVSYLLSVVYWQVPAFITDRCLVCRHRSVVAGICRFGQRWNFRAIFQTSNCAVGRQFSGDGMDVAVDAP